jgi:hypothetical protein
MPAAPRGPELVVQAYEGWEYLAEGKKTLAGMLALLVIRMLLRR